MKVCMQETESVMSALHSVAQAQLGPACRSDHKQDQHLAAIVCGMQQAERRKYLNMPKSNMPKHAERRNMPEDKHAANMPERPRTKHVVVV